MLKWNNSLYLGRMVQTREAEIRERLDSGKIDIGHYLITISVNPNDMLDIISTGTLITDHQRSQLPTVVGIAESKAEAVRLVIRITEDCIRECGNADLRTYLLREPNT